MQQISSPIIFVRHGATDWNLAGRYQGMTDTVLSSTGARQAVNSAELINAMIADGDLDEKKLAIVTSPLSRASQTAKIIAQTQNIALSPAINPAFRELSMGRWEGLTSQQVKDQFYEERKLRKTTRWKFKPLGGESMEDRCLNIRSALENLSPGTIVVTHSGILRIICYLLGEGTKGECAMTDTPHEKIMCWNGAKLHRQPSK